MNYTTAFCGCAVPAVGAPGSDERLRCETECCPDCAGTVPDVLAGYESLARRFGPANCWTGTTGTLAAALLRCIKRIRFREGIA